MDLGVEIGEGAVLLQVSSQPQVLAFQRPLPKPSSPTLPLVTTEMTPNLPSSAVCLGPTLGKYKKLEV